MMDDTLVIPEICRKVLSRQCCHLKIIRNAQKLLLLYIKFNQSQNNLLASNK